MVAQSKAVAVGRRYTLCVAGWLLVVCSAAAQNLTTLEAVNARRSTDYGPALDGQTVVVQGVVSTPAIHFPGYSHLPIQDESGHGLALEAAPAQFDRLQPGQRVEARGTVSQRGGLPVLLPAAIRPLGHGTAPAPLKATLAALRSFEHMGALVTVDGAIVEVGENTGGEYLLIGEVKRPLKVFLPMASLAKRPALARFEAGDKVRVTGVAAQYCPLPPYNRYFEIILPDDDNVVLLSKRWLVSPELFLVSLASLVFALGVWWMRERRMSAQRGMVRSFYTLGEEMTGATCSSDALRKLESVLPGVLGITGVQLYLYNRATKSLDRAPQATDSAPFSQPVYPPEGSLPLGAAACFRNQALLTIPDTHRSPFFPDGRRGEQPRTVLFVPMFAETELVGVLEISDLKPVHDFSPDEKVLTQHLANQIAIALRLIEEKSIREQLSRSEKLAAIGQLISGVASELRSPLENIAQLSKAVMTAPESASWNDLAAISEEAQKASEIVGRLVSFMQPERTEAKRIDLNTLLRSLIEFRKAEWEARGYEVHEALSPTPASVLGSQGQLERVFLDLLVQAEQSLAETAEKRLTISSSVLARRVLVEISYGVNPLKGVRDPGVLRESVVGTPGESVSRGIVRSHGGEMRLVRVGEGECRLELELPMAPARLAEETTGARPFTCLVVEPDAAERDALVALLTNRGCRVIPAACAEDGMELVQRMRFDFTFCAIRLPGLNWVSFSEQIRPATGAFVLLSEGYDYELSRGLLSADTHVLMRPFTDAELDQCLAVAESRLSEAAPSRNLRIVRSEKKAISL